MSTQSASNLFVIYSRVFPGEIRKIMVDRNHFGSKHLAELLLPKQLMVNAEFIDSELPLDPRVAPFFRNQSIDAWLVAGDHNFFMNRQNFPWHVDLTQAWANFANLPFVIHCWGVRKGVSVPTLAEDFSSAANFASGKTREIAEREASRLGAPVNVLETYFSRSIQTRMDAPQITGLRRFAKEIVQAKIFRPLNQLAIYRPPVQTGIRRI